MEKTYKKPKLKIITHEQIDELEKQANQFLEKEEVLKLVNLKVDVIVRPTGKPVYFVYILFLEK